MVPRLGQAATGREYLWRIWFYPLAGLMLLAATLLLWRDWSTGGWHYHFLSLEHLPGVDSICLQHRGGPTGPLAARSVGMVVSAVVAWLAFLPNAPYIVTDFIHLRHAPSAWFAYDAVLIGSFAAVGCLLGVVSIQIMQRVVCRHAGQFWSWAFAVTVMGLSGIGIYMGRVLRWNSWDLVTRPDDIADAVLGTLQIPRPPASHRAQHDPGHIPCCLLRRVHDHFGQAV